MILSQFKPFLATRLSSYIQLILVLFGLQVPCVLYCQSLAYMDGIAAIVNDEIITVFDITVFNAEVEKKIQQHYASDGINDERKKQQFADEINRRRIDAAQELINQKLIFTEFTKKGYQLPAEFIDQRIDDIVASQAGGNWRKFEEMLIETGTTLEEFRKKVEKKLAVDVFINQTIDRNISITPKQIENYFQANKTQYIEPKLILLQIIALEEKQFLNHDVFQKNVEKVAGLINEGHDFTDLVNQFTTHSSKEKNGELGWMKVDDIRPEFKSALISLEKNQISAPVNFQGTTYFVRVADVKESNEKTLSSVYDQIKNQLFAIEKKRRYETLVADLRNKAFVRTFYKE